MKTSFSKALKIFKYLFILFALAYWIGIIIDDWIFIEKYWNINNTKWIQGIGIWAAYFIVYAIVFSLYYWGIAAIIILIYHKTIQAIKKKTG